MTTTIPIQEALERAFSPSYIEIIDESHHHRGHPGAASGGGHFKLTIAAAAFEGKSRLECHRLIYAALGNMMHKSIPDGLKDEGYIHALSIHIKPVTS